jgi:hypothetical protein
MYLTAWIARNASSYVFVDIESTKIKEFLVLQNVKI